MTISQVLRGLTTLNQYDVLSRADRIFWVGRFWGGVLTPEEFSYLTEGLKLA